MKRSMFEEPLSPSTLQQVSRELDFRAASTTAQLRDAQRSRQAAKGNAGH
jgi:hypothetical protein